MFTYLFLYKSYYQNVIKHSSHQLQGIISLKASSSTLMLDDYRERRIIER